MKYLEMINDYSLYMILSLCGVVILLFILYIINIVQMNKLKKRYKIFMTGNNAKNLEDTIIKRLDQVDTLIEANSDNSKKIELLFKSMIPTFQKFGMVKYDAFQEMGGKLSFSLALLDQKNDGFIINAMHSREGCYTYIKEIVDGNCYIALAEEEKEALLIAQGEEKNK